MAGICSAGTRVKDANGAQLVKESPAMKQLLVVLTASQNCLVNGCDEMSDATSWPLDSSVGGDVILSFALSS